MDKNLKVGDSAVWIEAVKLLSKYIKPGKITGIKKIGKFIKYVVEFKYCFPRQKKWKRARLLLPRKQLISPAGAKVIASSMDLIFEVKATTISLKILGLLKRAENALNNKSYGADKKAIKSERKKLKKEVLQFKKDAKQQLKEAEELAQLIIKATIK